MSEWLWPCPGHSTLTSGVGERWGRYHNGIDISAPRRANVIASRAGKVTTAFNQCSHDYPKDKDKVAAGVKVDDHSAGNYIVIDHGDGYITRYLHLSEILVNLGDQVSIGQLIGRVGSTGISTDNHLHFEIKKGNQVLDPELFVNSSNTKVPEYNDNPTDSKEIPAEYSSYATSVNDSSTSLATTISSSIPLHAYLRIFIGEDIELKYEHGKPSMIQSFEINRLAEDGAGAKGIITIFDDNWDEIEYFLSQHSDDIRIQYGYAGGVSSPFYKVMLQGYSIDIRGTGAILVIEFISEAAYQNINQADSAFDTETVNPTEAVKAICEQLGYIVDDANFDKTNDITDRDESYKSIGYPPASYIVNVIAKEAITPEGETMTFWVDADNTAHFKAVKYDEESMNSAKTYVYRRGYNSPVVDLTFNINSIFGGTDNFTVTGLEGNSIDKFSKEESNKVEDQRTVDTSSAGLYSWTRAKQSIARYDSAGDSRGQMSAKLYYYIKNSTTLQYEATLTIIGDPEIHLLENIRIVNMTDSGHLHHTSGLYMVLGITDTVESGKYLTTLKLNRIGDIDGIELRDPRMLLK